jgi:hypothetical protein
MSPRSKGKICVQLTRPPARKCDHFATGVESEVTVTAPLPFLQIGTGSRAQLKDALYFDGGELADRRFEEVDFLAEIPEAESDLVVFRALVDVHMRILRAGRRIACPFAAPAKVLVKEKAAERSTLRPEVNSQRKID